MRSLHGIRGHRCAPPGHGHGDGHASEAGTKRGDDSANEVRRSRGASRRAERPCGRGNMEGTQARPRASTRGSVLAVRSRQLAGLSWSRVTRPYPRFPPQNLNGKEGVDGSSPSEGSVRKAPQMRGFSFSQQLGESGGAPLASLAARRRLLRPLDTAREWRSRPCSNDSAENEHRPSLSTRRSPFSRGPAVRSEASTSDSRSGRSRPFAEPVRARAVRSRTAAETPPKFRRRRTTPPPVAGERRHPFDGG